jgi:hypothetical protein
MKDTSVEKEKITVEYVGENIPDSVKNFMPDLYRDGNRFVCVLGREPDSITGEGESVEEAMKNWDEAYRAKK